MRLAKVFVFDRVASASSSRLKPEQAAAGGGEAEVLGVVRHGVLDDRESVASFLFV